VARLALLTAAVLLAVPGFFIGARGVSGLRRGETVVRGRVVTGAQARTIAALLVAYGIGFVAVGAVLAARALR